MTSSDSRTPIRELEDKVVGNIDLILSALSIEYTHAKGRFFFPCPIHGSDNYSSLSMYESGHWRCFTKNCHSQHEIGIFGFVAAVRNTSKKEAIQFCSNVLGGIEVGTTVIKKKNIDYRCKLVDRSLILPNVNSSIEFYLRRGYTREILQKYDIFLCKKRTSNLYGRVVFPIYDDDRKNAVGFVGRSLNPQCVVCNKYHSTSKPCPQLPYEKIAAEKWLNSKGFARNNTLFNLWFAKDFIRETGKAILVEGQGDVLKLEMADIRISLGIFGTILTKSQISLLAKSGAKEVYIATDNDEAGQIAATNIETQLANDFTTHRLITNTKDFGDMNVGEIMECIPSI